MLERCLATGLLLLQHHHLASIPLLNDSDSLGLKLLISFHQQPLYFSPIFLWSAISITESFSFLTDALLFGPPTAGAHASLGDSQGQYGTAGDAFGGRGTAPFGGPRAPTGLAPPGEELKLRILETSHRKSARVQQYQRLEDAADVGFAEGVRETVVVGGDDVGTIAPYVCDIIDRA